MIVPTCIICCFRPSLKGVSLTTTGPSNGNHTCQFNSHEIRMFFIMSSVGHLNSSSSYYLSPIQQGPSTLCLTSELLNSLPPDCTSNTKNGIQTRALFDICLPKRYFRTVVNVRPLIDSRLPGRRQGYFSLITVNLPPLIIFYIKTR